MWRTVVTNHKATITAASQKNNSTVAQIKPAIISPSAATPRTVASMTSGCDGRTVL